MSHPRDVANAGEVRKLKRNADVEKMQALHRLSSARS
jgi:hypothetical protein